MNESKIKSSGKAVYHYNGGLKDFVSYLDESREGITPEPIHIRGEVEGSTC